MVVVCFIIIVIIVYISTIEVLHSNNIIMLMDNVQNLVWMLFISLVVWYIENRNMNYCGIFYWDDVQAADHTVVRSSAHYYHYSYGYSIGNTSGPDWQAGC